LKFGSKTAERSTSACSRKKKPKPSSNPEATTTATETGIILKTPTMSANGSKRPVITTQKTMKMMIQS
ncbi:GSCOCG00001500001-RA-CDS, partial [Cotesia congregata]